MNLKHIFSKISLPTVSEMRRAIVSFPKKRKIVFFCFLCLFFVSSVNLISEVAIQRFQEEVPVFGGIHKEGIMGTPRFINPVLSFSNVDRDIETLVFAGLTQKKMDGSIVLDLAEDVTVSQDNLVYTFTIQEDARFHDGQPITAEDVVFTIQKIQDPEIKSPRQVQWEGVNIEAIDDRRVRFTLRQPFVNFLENASIGIIPKHQWENISALEFPFSPLNINPVGSGKYKVTSVSQKQSSVENITLTSFRQYQGDAPYIQKIYFYFFEDDKQAVRAFRNNQIDAIAGLNPSSIKDLPNNATIYTATLHRMFGIFFNQQENSPIQERSVRQAINIALDRQDIIDEALYGFGAPIKTPLPPNIQTNNPERENIDSNIAEANQILNAAGWIREENGTRVKNGRSLSLTLTTGSITELETAAESIKRQLAEIGIDITIETLDMNDLNQNVIRPRNFEMLLFGNMINQESDIFPFWHSSQTRDPGLNIASYKNVDVDRILERILRTFDTRERARLYTEFENQFFQDVPATFLYSPEFIYVLDDTIYNITLSPITNSSQRFLDMQEWYKESNYVIPRPGN